jgi:hypothetical protein
MEVFYIALTGSGWTLAVAVMGWRKVFDKLIASLGAAAVAVM